jgi:hypothetical protein
MKRVKLDEFFGEPPHQNRIVGSPTVIQLKIGALTDQSLAHAHAGLEAAARGFTAIYRNGAPACHVLITSNG